MAAFLARKVAASALKNTAPIINKTANNIKAAGHQQIDNLQKASKKCTIEFQKCVKTESTKMKKELGGIVKKAGTNMQLGGRKRRRSRKRKRSGKRHRTRKRSGKRSRKRSRKRSGKLSRKRSRKRSRTRKRRR